MGESLPQDPGHHLVVGVVWSVLRGGPVPLRHPPILVESHEPVLDALQNLVDAPLRLLRFLPHRLLNLQAISRLVGLLLLDLRLVQRDGNRPRQAGQDRHV